MTGSGILLYTFALTGLIVKTLTATAHQPRYSSFHPHPLQVNATHNGTHNATNQTVAAPYYRNVSAGNAWVMPSSAYDIGARDMTCECFDPDNDCCIATSNYVAPFCIPKNYTCCGDTFCIPGETCCGDSCCPKLTSCWFSPSGAGCCPHGQQCAGPSMCHDHDSGNCSDPLNQQCCPPDLPYCRNFPPFGQGCYASSSIASTTNSVPSAAKTTPFPPGLGFDGHHSVKPPTANKSTATVLEVVTVVSKPSGAFSFIFPSAPSEPPNAIISTTFILTFPSSNSSTISANSSQISSPVPSSTVTSTSSATLSKTTTSTTSVLCFNPTIQSPEPCPTTTTHPVASTTNNGGFPGASTVASQANALLPPFNLPFSLHQLYSLGLTLFVLILGFGMMNLASREHNERPVLARRDSEKMDVGRDIQLVEGSGRVLVGELGREVKVVKESGRRFSNGLLIDGEKVWAVE